MWRGVYQAVPSSSAAGRMARPRRGAAGLHRHPRSLELDRSAEDVAFIRAVCEAMIAGRGYEVSALQRSRVVVHWPTDGRCRKTGYEGCPVSLIPLPFWPHWADRVDFQSYEPHADPS